MCPRWAAVLACIALAAISMSRVSAASNSMQHLATKAPYAHRVPIPGAPSIHAAPDPAGYKPVYMYLVARHGTRWPTAGRSRQMAKLVHLLRDATAPEHQWAVNWTCPVHDIPYVAGELHDTGVDEMFGLGVRLRDRFPMISQHRYYPKRFPLVSTQVARAAQSANAFALGFFSPTEQPDGAEEDAAGYQQPNDDASQPNHHQQQQQQQPRETNTDKAGTYIGSSSSSSQPMSLSREAEEGMHGEIENLGSRQGNKRMQRSSSSSTGASPQRKRLHVQQLDTSSGTSAAHVPEAAPTPSPSSSKGQSGPYAARDHAVRAVALTMAPKQHDPLLRFFESSKDYQQHERQVERWLAPWLMCHWAPLAPTLEKRLGLPAGRLTAKEVDALWQLCGFEAGVLGVQDQSCKLFLEQDAQLMEWLEDVRLYEVQAYGSPINYQIAAPLLEDLTASLLKAASEAVQHPNHQVQQARDGAVDLEDDEAMLQPTPIASDDTSTTTSSSSSSSSRGAPNRHRHKGPIQVAKLHFAHCETLTPLSALLGLFKPTGAEAAAEPSAGLDLEAELAAAAAAQQGSNASPPVTLSSSSTRGSSSQHAASAASAAGTAAAAAGAGGTQGPEAPISIDSTDDVLYAMLEEGLVQDMTAEQAVQLSKHPIGRDTGGNQPHSSSSDAGGHAAGAADAGAGAASERVSTSDGSSSSGLDVIGSNSSSSSSDSSSRFLYRGKRWIEPLPAPVGWTPLSMGGPRDSRQDSQASSTSSPAEGETVAGSARSDAESAGDDKKEWASAGNEQVVVQHRRLRSGSSTTSDAARPVRDSTAGEVPGEAGDGRGDDRMFRGGRVSPLGANLLVVLYQQQQQQQRPGLLPDAAHVEEFRVRVVWNEQVVVVPGCSGPDVPLTEFLECVAAAKA